MESSLTQKAHGALASFLYHVLNFYGNAMHAKCKHIAMISIRVLNPELGVSVYFIGRGSIFIAYLAKLILIV